MFLNNERPIVELAFVEGTRSVPIIFRALSTSPNSHSYNPGLQLIVLHPNITFIYLLRRQTNNQLAISRLLSLFQFATGATIWWETGCLNRFSHFQRFRYLTCVLLKRRTCASIGSSHMTFGIGTQSAACQWDRKRRAVLRNEERVRGGERKLMLMLVLEVVRWS